MVRVRPLALALVAALSLTVGTGTAAAAQHVKAGTRGAPAFPKYSKAFQLRYHVAPKSDPDNDGLNSYNEFLAGTNPKRADTDNNGRSDGLEDRDKDGLNNATEQAVHSNPARRDTNSNHRADGDEDRDHDGLSNLAEQRTGNDPLDADTDDDGTLDGDENVGRIVRFDAASGTLRLWLASEGRVVTATFTEDTKVLCPEIQSDDGAPVIDDGTSADDVVVDDGSSSEADSADVVVTDDQVDDGSYDDSAIPEDQVADDGSMCIDSVKRGTWFSDVELYDDADTGELMVDLLQLAAN